jgi:hypothetical protein
MAERPLLRIGATIAAELSQKKKAEEKILEFRA